MSENFNFARESEELFKTAILSFAAWASENWTMRDGEAETLNDPSPAPKEYQRGYNDCVESIVMAADLWLDEVAK